jgi:adenylate cyclase
MNYTMMGDAVNLAARLESAAKQYGIYTMISNMTYAIIENEFTVRQVDKITVVGKSEPVTVYELISEKGQEPPEYGELLGKYNRGLEFFYAQEWENAIETLRECEKIEPFRDIAPKGMNPSRRIREYAEAYRDSPPGADWDGVTRLTAK